VAISRIILDKHFLSDVIFGFIIGLSMVILSRYVYSRFGVEIGPKKEKRIYKAA
jgi:membrane-associated phospholipid phosphatase